MKYSLCFNEAEHYACFNTISWLFLLKLLAHIGLAWLALPSLVYFKLLCSCQRRARRGSPTSPGHSPRRPFVAECMRHSHGGSPSFGRRRCQQWFACGAPWSLRCQTSIAICWRCRDFPPGTSRRLHNQMATYLGVWRDAWPAYQYPEKFNNSHPLRRGWVANPSIGYPGKTSISEEKQETRFTQVQALLTRCNPTPARDVYCDWGVQTARYYPGIVCCLSTSSVPAYMSYQGP